MSKVRTILCAADPGGSESAVETLAAAAESRDVDGIAIVGDISASAAAGGYRSLFHALATSGRPAYWVPGPQDAPLDAYFRAAHAIEATHPQLRGVHGTAALTPDGQLIVAGVGGEIDDNPGAAREETQQLRYPRLEDEYRLTMSLVVSRGSLQDGHYAVVDLQTREVELAEPDTARSA